MPLTTRPCAWRLSNHWLDKLTPDYHDLMSVNHLMNDNHCMIYAGHEDEVWIRHDSTSRDVISNIVQLSFLWQFRPKGQIHEYNFIVSSNKVSDKIKVNWTIRTSWAWWPRLLFLGNPDVTQKRFTLLPAAAKNEESRSNHMSTTRRHTAEKITADFTHSF